MDICDRAQQSETAFRKLALDAQGQLVPDTAKDPRIRCIGCGLVIPEARRNAVPGCVRCVFCEEEFEERR
jgi:phage/conjugal plasmid C-4 type zinc finger TraR family protein